MTSRSSSATTSHPLHHAGRLDLLGIEGSFRAFVEARALEAQGREVIHLEFGEPDFSAPPHVIEAAMRALREGATKYTPPAGIPELRAALADAARSRGIGASMDDIIVTSGAKPMLQYAVFAVVEPGDEVLVPDSGFPIYPSLVLMAGGTPVGYPIVRRGGAYALDLEALEAAITPRTRVLMLNSPHNPTGWVASPDDLRAIANLALKHNLWVIADDIYDGLTYGPGGSPSIAAIPELQSRTIVVDGFSKRYAMTGFRLGFGIVPKELAGYMAKLVVNNTSCAPAFVQLAGVAAVEGSQQCVADFREAFRERGRVFSSALNAIPGVAAPLPAGAFYAFADVRDVLARSGLSIRALSTRLLQEQGVAGLPGTDFGPGGDGFLRFSFASSLPQLQKAAELIAESIESLTASHAPLSQG